MQASCVRQPNAGQQDEATPGSGQLDDLESNTVLRHRFRRLFVGVVLILRIR
jgi:hypothetical protein